MFHHDERSAQVPNPNPKPGPVHSEIETSSLGYAVCQLELGFIPVFPLDCKNPLSPT